jgi:hypothetical protein
MPLDAATLAQLYGNHYGYVSAVSDVNYDNVKAGYLLSEGAEPNIFEAAQSGISYWQSGSIPPPTGATAAPRARRSTSMPPMMAMSRSTSQSGNIGIASWPRWAARTCATTRVSRRMPPVSPTSGRRTLLSGAWTQTLSKMEVFTIIKEHRGARRRRGHARRAHARARHARMNRPRRNRPYRRPDLAIRFSWCRQGSDRTQSKLGQHNDNIYGDWLGLSQSEIVDLKQSGVI